MRTTLAIDDDVLAAARHLAEREQRSVGDVISMLARRGLSLRAGEGAASHRNGIPLLARADDPVAVTLELVNQLRDESP